MQTPLDFFLLLLLRLHRVPMLLFLFLSVCFIYFLSAFLSSNSSSSIIYRNFQQCNALAVGALAGFYRHNVCNWNAQKTHIKRNHKTKAKTKQCQLPTSFLSSDYGFSFFASKRNRLQQANVTREIVCGNGVLMKKGRNEQSRADERWNKQMANSNWSNGKCAGEKKKTPRTEKLTDKAKQNEAILINIDGELLCFCLFNIWAKGSLTSVRLCMTEIVPDIWLTYSDAKCLQKLLPEWTYKLWHLFSGYLQWGTHTTISNSLVFTGNRFCFAFSCCPWMSKFCKAQKKTIFTLIFSDVFSSSLNGAL